MFFSIANFASRLRARFHIWFWKSYHRSECLRSRVKFKNPKTISFFGRCFLNISPKATVEIGDNFICRSGKYSGMESLITKLSVYEGGALKIGDNSGISNCTLSCKCSIEIGSHVLIGAGVMISDSDHHSLDWKIRQGSDDGKNAHAAPIKIGDDVFIGARSIILKGVTIGEKSVIGAGSIVVHDIPANCIAAGNPAKVVKVLEA